MAGTFNVSAILKADASNFVAGTTAAAAATGALAAAQAKASTAAGNLTNAHAALAQATNSDSAAQAAARDAVAAAERAYTSASGSLRKLQQAQSDNIKINGQHRASVQDLGYQISDLGTSILSGNGVLRSLAQQSGQVAFALSGMEGTAGSVGKFLAGPWGAALLIGAEALTPLIAKLFDGTSELEAQRKALDELVKSADAFGNTETELGRVIDLSTGKFKSHNAVLLETVRLQQQLALQQATADLKTATAAYGKPAAGKPVVLDPAQGSVGTYGAGGVSLAQVEAQDARFAALKSQSASLADIMSHLTDVANQSVGAGAQAAHDYGVQVGAAVQAALSKVDALSISGKVAGKNLTDVKTAILGIGTAAEQKASAIEGLGVLAGGKVPGDLTPYKAAAKPKKAPDTSGLVNSVKNDIASYTAEFTDAPTFIEKAQADLRKLDADAAALEKRKPPNYQALLDQIAATKSLINDNLNKPFEDFLKQQDEAIAYQHLLATGHVDEAAAYKDILALQKQQGTLGKDQVGLVLQRVAALRQEQEATARLKELQQEQTQALGSVKTAITGALSGGSIKGAFDGLLSGFKQLQGENLFESLFGPAFRSLEAQIEGNGTIKGATDQFAAAVNKAADSADVLADALKRTANAAPLNGGIDAGDVRALLRGGAAGGLIANNSDLYQGDTGQITVTGHLNRNSGETDVAFYDRIGKAIGASLDKALGTHFAQTVGSRLGDALQGAGLGSEAGGILNQITGGKGSSLGSQLGGALGESLGKGIVSKGLTAISSKLAGFAGPLAGVLGGIAGDLLGGLLTSTKKATATISSVFGSASVSGNNSQYEQAVSGLATGVQSGLKDIVKQLGGELGSFAVSLTEKNGKFIVDSAGLGRTTRGKSNDGIVTYSDAQSAEAAALQNAIADGAVQGLSAAVAKALKSSTDVSAAVAEALDVENLQAALGGVTGQMQQALQSFEATAQQRLELAKKYGLDLVATEKLNDKDRAAALQQIVDDQLGSLKDLQSSLSTGDLFEGSAADKLKAIKADIAAALTDFANGVSGAADRLATDYQNELSTAKTAYGTAGGEYAGVYNDVSKSITDLIAQTTQQAKDAQAAVDQQLGLANENNDQNAQMIGLLGTISGQLGGTGAGAGLNGNTRGVSRVASL